MIKKEFSKCREHIPNFPYKKFKKATSRLERRVQRVILVTGAEDIPPVATKSAYSGAWDIA